MKKKQIITIAILVVLLVGGGIAECLIVNAAFDKFEEKLTNLWTQAENKSIVYSDFEECLNYWKTTRETIEMFLNHLDITEIDLRLAECKAYIVNKDYTNAMAQLSILLEMAEHIPHMGMPSLEHII